MVGPSPWSSALILTLHWHDERYSKYKELKYSRAAVNQCCCKWYHWSKEGTHHSIKVMFVLQLSQPLGFSMTIHSIRPGTRREHVQALKLLKSPQMLRYTVPSTGTSWVPDYYNLGLFVSFWAPFLEIITKVTLLKSKGAESLRYSHFGFCSVMLYPFSKQWGHAVPRSL